MKTVPARALELNEVGVVKNALIRAALRPVLPSMLEDIEELKVIGICECGCASVYFREPQSADYIIADAVGYAAGGERIGIAVWASAHHEIAALEMIDHRGGNLLPPAESVCSWDQAGVRELKQ